MVTRTKLLVAVCLLGGCVFRAGEDPPTDENATTNNATTNNTTTTSNNATTNNATTPPNNDTNNTTANTNNATTSTNNQTLACSSPALNAVCEAEVVCGEFDFGDECTQACGECASCMKNYCLPDATRWTHPTTDSNPAVDMWDANHVIGLNGRAWLAFGDEKTQLQSTNLAATDGFGTAVALGPQRAAVGAPAHRSNEGGVGLFGLDGTSLETITASQVTTPDGTLLERAESPRLGQSVTTGDSGRWALGAPGAHTVVLCDGAPLSCDQMLPGDQPSDATGYGARVDFNRTASRLAVSAPPANVIEVWEFTVGAWRRAEMDYDIPILQSNCGRALAMSPDGDRLAFTCDSSGRGPIHVLNRSRGPNAQSPGVWGDHIVISTPEQEEPGAALALSGRFLWTSVPDADRRGIVRVWFEVPEMDLWLLFGEIDGTTQEVDQLGAALSASPTSWLMTGVMEGSTASLVYDVPRP